MFYIDIKLNGNNKAVYEITKLENNIIKCEPPHIKRIIPQCTRCQAHGHTKTYCRKSYRCVKCAGEHKTGDCTRKVRDEKVKCVNCNGNHPANYKGCAVHKQLQQKLYPALREKRHQQKQSTTTNLPLPTRTSQPDIIYAQIVENGSAQKRETISQPTETSNISRLENMMAKLMDQMSTMLGLLTTVVSKLA
ncbi:hypothetical protein GWI33_022766 [Rhynchophorus ferrugineus]|uniref:Nucleic-acid-binding protein from transposon X-element n=1 Tax=Rhynchophorus ferrugineus TaxID=354439 RepID=A0A834IPQ4_RHYFE|nr:hypothetical protein GWI33_022766 [Rhynchophorus ferrugineus]